MNLLKMVAAVIFGITFCFGFAPFEFWPAAVLAICGFYWSLLNNPHPLTTAWLFGIGKYGFGASWVYVSINVYGGASPTLALFLVSIFVAGMALFCIPIGWLWRRYSIHLTAASCVLLFAGSYVLIDWLLTWFLTGFPWLFPSYALLDTPFDGYLPVLGALGTSFLFVCAAVSVLGLFLHWSNPALRRLLGLAAIIPWGLGLALSYMSWTTAVETKTATLVQGNLDQNLKWQTDQRIPNLRTHLQLSAPHWVSSDVVIWPEAAITMFPQQAQAILADLQEQAFASKTNFLTGIPGAKQLPDGSYSFENLILGLGLARGQFAKHHLVPFGDYVPLEGVLRGLIEFFDLPMSNAVPGAAGQDNIKFDFGEVASAICYEIAYGDSVRKRAKQAQLLVTISNDTWFGSSIGPHQHMQIARVRARENGRWLLRATNNGVTGFVNPQGEITAQLPQFEATALTETFQVMQGRTPYSWLGDWPILLVLLLCFVGFERKKKHTEKV